MTWTETLNFKPSTGADFVFRLIAAAVAAGGTVLADSDGTTYSPTGTAVMNPASGAGGFANAFAWRRVRFPNGQEFTFQRSSTDNVNWRIERSPVSGFTGTGDATHTPAAEDAILELGGGSNSSPTFAALIGSADGSGWWAQIRVENTAPFRALAFGCADHGAGGVYTLFALDWIRTPAGTSDPDPWVVHCAGRSPGDMLSETQLTDDSGTYPVPHGALGGAHGSLTAPSWWAQGGGGLAVPGDVPRSPLTSAWDLFPLFYMRRGSASNPTGVKGTSTLFRWNPQATHVTGDTYSIDKSADRVVLANVVALWGGVGLLGSPSNVTPTDHGAATDWARLPTSVDAPAPVVAFAFPQPGQIVHRNDAIAFSVTDSTGGFRDVLVLVKFPSGVWELAYDGATFSALYAAQSVATPSGDSAYSFTLRRSPGWPQTPTIDVRAIDTTGNENG